MCNNTKCHCRKQEAAAMRKIRSLEREVDSALEMIKKHLLGHLETMRKEIVGEKQISIFDNNEKEKRNS